VGRLSESVANTPGLVLGSLYFIFFRGVAPAGAFLYPGYFDHEGHEGHEEREEREDWLGRSGPQSEGSRQVKKVLRAEGAAR